MSEKSGAQHGAEGIVEDIKGKAKEVLGKVTGKEHLEDEGRAQQEKADASETWPSTRRRLRPPGRRPRLARLSSGSSKSGRSAASFGGAWAAIVSMENDGGSLLSSPTGPGGLVQTGGTEICPRSVRRRAAPAGRENAAAGRQVSAAGCATDGYQGDVIARYDMVSHDVAGDVVGSAGLIASRRRSRPTSSDSPRRSMSPSVPGRVRRRAARLRALLGHSGRGRAHRGDRATRGEANTARARRRRRDR